MPFSSGRVLKTRALIPRTSEPTSAVLSSGQYIATQPDHSGTFVNSGTETGVTVTNTGSFKLGVYPVYLLQFDLPTAQALVPGKYWLDLNSPCSATVCPAVYWVTSNANARDGKQFLNGFDNNLPPSEMAFELESATVPEPGSVPTILGAASVLLLARRHRRV